MKPEWNMKVPVISTSHIELETMNRLSYSRIPGFMSAEYDEGVFIYVPNPAPDDCPVGLKAVVDWYNENYTESEIDCWLRLDSQGDVIEELPTYDW